MPHGKNQEITWTTDTYTWRGFTVNYYRCNLNDLQFSRGLGVDANGELYADLYRPNNPMPGGYWTTLNITETASQTFQVIQVAQPLLQSEHLNVKTIAVDFSTAPSPINSRSDYICLPHPQYSGPFIASESVPSYYTENTTPEQHRKALHNFTKNIVTSGISQKVIMTPTEMQMRWVTGTSASRLDISPGDGSGTDSGNIFGYGYSDITSGNGDLVFYHGLALYNDHPDYAISSMMGGVQVNWYGADAGASPTYHFGSVIDQYTDSYVSNIDWVMWRTVVTNPGSAGDELYFATYPRYLLDYYGGDGGSNPLETTEYGGSNPLFIAAFDQSEWYTQPPAYPTPTTDNKIIPGGYIPQ